MITHNAPAAFNGDESCALAVAAAAVVVVVAGEAGASAGAAVFADAGRVCVAEPTCCRPYACEKVCDTGAENPTTRLEDTANSTASVLARVLNENAIPSSTSSQPQRTNYTVPNRPKHTNTDSISTVKRLQVAGRWSCLGRRSLQAFVESALIALHRDAAKLTMLNTR